MKFFTNVGKRHICVKNNVLGKDTGGWHWLSAWAWPQEHVRSAAITEYHRLGDLNSRNLFSYNFGNWKLEMKLPAGLASGFSPWFADGCLLTVTLQAHSSCDSFSNKDISPKGFMPYDLIQLYSLKIFPNTATFRIRASMNEFWGTLFSPVEKHLLKRWCFKLVLWSNLQGVQCTFLYVVIHSALLL